MHPKFAKIIPTVHEAYLRLIAMKPVKRSALPATMPTCGVYLFSEGGRHLYVGRSNGIRKRIGRHCRPSAAHWMATFAFRLARKKTRRLTATYRQKGSRADLLNDPAFAKAFREAKVRIQRMDIRFVEETDQTRQTLLELYAATALATPYNDFNTH